MIVSAKIAGFQFETVLDLFFIDNPGQTEHRARIEDELKRFGDVTCWAPGYTVKCVLTLIKE
jgi:hypothetical protein